MDIKKLIGVTAAIAIASSCIVIPHVSAQEVVVKLDGKVLECPIPARVNNSSTMVPMRAIFEAFGMDVVWNNEEKSVTATKGEDTVKLVIGKKVLTVNGTDVELSVAPYIEDDTTLVPVRAISEGLDAKVTWNGYTKQVDIVTDNYNVDSDGWKENEGKINLTDLTYTGDGVQVFDNVVVITSGGDFEVTGENHNAMIYVNALEKVKLRLKGVNLTNPDGPAIFFDNCEEALITVSKGSENFVTDGEEYAVDAKAAIFANDDIEIKGEGTLNVISKSKHAIASDDDIKIEEGTLVLNAEKKDGIHANNTIKILGGNITVTAFGDGIQSEEDIIIESGNINVTTTGEVIESNANKGGFGGGMPQGSFGGRGNREWGNRIPSENGMMPDGMTPPDGMQMPWSGMEPPQGGMLPPNEETPNMSEEALVEDEIAATKGIKAETNIEISGGQIVVNSNDHAIHCADTISVTGGEMQLKSAFGKGISAHGDVVINDGLIVVEKATEGLESKANFTINGGDIKVFAADDGINAGGTDGRDVVNRQNSDAETGHDLVINGGKVYVNASGDGLDANGRMIINGGDIVVEGPTNSGNGALDSGGSIKVNGGTLIALGASGMAETPDNDSNQASFRLVTENNIPVQSTIIIKDSAGNEIYSYTTEKTGNSIVFSSDKIKLNESYTVIIGEMEHSITITSMVTSSGNGGFGGFGGGRGWR